MHVYQTTLDDFSISYPLETIGEPEQLLFMDIETTGFTAGSSSLYMIGCAYFKNNAWHTIQWMADNTSEEKEILEAFFQFASDYSFLIHFNGNNFDLPYLMQKCRILEISCPLESFRGLDLYRRLSPCKSFLGLPDCKQKTLECFMGLHREDQYNGGELIGVYQDYCKNPDEETASLLLLHNVEDLKGMLTILPMLSYQDVLSLPVKARKVQANHYRDVDDNRRMELMITVSLSSSLPKSLTLSSAGFFARMESSECTLRVPVFEGELKYFYSGYRDYYYLPEEDMALHKSVATFVDKDHRQQATAQNCYTRKESIYLRQWDALFTPFFKKNYQSHELYFELTDEMKRDRAAFASYASHVLNMLCGNV